MVCIFAILGFLFVVGIAFGVEFIALRRLSHRYTDLDVLRRDLSPECKYQPMARLFARGDFDYLRTRETPDAKTGERLRKARRVAMRLYLKEVRTDFLRVWSICRFLAPFSPDPDFGVFLFRQFIAFYALYVALWVRCLVSIYGFIGLDVADIEGVVNSVRKVARHTLQAADDLALELSGV